MATSISLDDILKAIQAAESINFPAAFAAVKSGDAGQILGVVEQVTGILADLGVPYANDAKIAEAILGFVIKGYETGLIRSAQPEDPAMQRAAGNTGQGTPQMHQPPVIEPGGTVDNPYNF